MACLCSEEVGALRGTVVDFKDEVDELKRLESVEGKYETQQYQDYWSSWITGLMHSYSDSQDANGGDKAGQVAADRPHGRRGLDDKSRVIVSLSNK